MNTEGHEEANTLIVKFKLTIGFPGACIEDEIEIDEEELEGLEGEARDKKIGEIIWDHAMQYVNVPWKIVEG